MNTEWFEGSGRGTIYSYTINHRGDGDYRDASPYVLAYVELEEGPRVLTNIVDCDLETIAVGDRVTSVLLTPAMGSRCTAFVPSP